MIIHTPTIVNMQHMLKYIWAPGAYIQIQRACFFLATKAATWLWFGMVIGNDHPHPHNAKYAPYVEVYGPQRPIYKCKGPTFS